MAPTASKHSNGERTTAKNGTRLLKPAIGLRRPEQKDEGKNADEKIKCRTNPTDANSTTYEIPMSYFRDRTPEEWLLFKKKLKRCIDGQNATTGQAKFELTRRLLAGRALADFNHAASIHGNETVPNYKRCHLIIEQTQLPQLLVIRAHAMQAEPIKNAFIDLWRQIRLLMLKADAIAPRIWFT